MARDGRRLRLAVAEGFRAAVSRAPASLSSGLDSIKRRESRKFGIDPLAANDATHGGAGGTPAERAGQFHDEGPPTDRSLVKSVAVRSSWPADMRPLPLLASIDFSIIDSSPIGGAGRRPFESGDSSAASRRLPARRIGTLDRL